MFGILIVLMNAISPRAFSNEHESNTKARKSLEYPPACTDIGTTRFDIENSAGVNSTYRSVSVLGSGDLLVNYTTGAGLANSRSKIVKANGTVVDGPNITISPATNNNTDVVFIKGLTNGNILVYWYSGSSGTGLTDAYFKIYNQSGSEILASTKINTSAGSLNRFVEFDQLSNGNIIFTWATSGTDYAMRRFQISGTPVDNAQISLTNLAGLTGQSQYAYKIAANANGRFMILIDYYSLVYRGMIFNNDATTPVQVGGSNSFIAMTAGSSGTHVDKTPNIIALPNNKFLLACRIQPGATSDRSLAFKVYNDDGSVAVADKTIRQIYSWGSVSFTPVAVADGFYMRYFYNDLNNGPNLGRVDYFEKYDFNCNFISDNKSCLPALTSNGNVYPFRDADTKLGILINDKLNESDPATEKNTWLFRNTSSCTAPVITANPPNRYICVGGNTILSATATGATTYQWQVNTGSGFSDISNGGVYSGATTGTLTISGAAAAMSGYLYRCVAKGESPGCFTNSNAATLTISSISLASGTQTNIACNGTSTGAASVAPSGGISPYTYSWSPSGGTAAMATGLAAGAYMVTVTDNIGCTATKSFTITQPTALSATASKTDVSCNGGSNGTASVAVSGGTPVYSYSWAPSGGTAATATGLAAGTYTVTVTDGNSCQITRTVTVNQPTALSATASKTDVSCNGGSNGAASVAVSGGTPTYSYSWSPSGGTAATATGLAAGTYTVTITDANSCQITRTVTVNQPTALSATASKTDVSCNGGNNGTASVAVSGGTPTYSYSWSPSGGTAATATGLAAGTYTVTITDGNSCQIMRTVTINQPTVLNATVSKTDVSCNGGSNGTATASATGGTGPYSYSWAPSGGTAATATGLAAGTYFVTITDNNTCQTTKNVTIIQPAAITVIATPAAETICSGSTTDISLTSSPSGAGFNWIVTTVSGSVSGASASGGSSIQQTLTGSGVIKYTVVPDNGLCSGTAKDILVTVNPLTMITLHPSNKMIDEEESTSFSVEAANASSYQWQVDAGNGFADVLNNVHYSGATTATLTVSNAIGEMDGYHYRCVATGNCAPVNSNSAELSVRVRTPQSISFASTDEKVYGAADFAPAATSDAGLEISYSSSNESIASVIDGKVHIKNAGEVIITATQAGNNDYKPASPVQQVLTIAKKQISLSLNAVPAIGKEYDGNTNITLAAGNYALQGVVEGDDVQVTGIASFEDSNAGVDKDIHVKGFVLNGASMNNYELITATAAVKGAVTRKSIEVSLHSAPAISKYYDGSDKATLAVANYSLLGIVGEDDVTVASSQASYSSKNAGYDKEITATAFVLDGAHKDNYSVSTVSANTTGDIIAKDITLSLTDAPAISKTYDGTAEATVPVEKYRLEGIEEGDMVSVTGEAEYNSRQAGDNKVVTVNAFVLDGGDKDNYRLTTTEVVSNGSIQKAALKVSLTATPAITKVYDGSTDAALAPQNYMVEGIVGDDQVVINYPLSGVYETQHGGDHKKVTVSGLQITGEDADNYSLESATVSGNVGVITKKPVEVTALPQTKVYGATDPELTYLAEGKLAEDRLAGALQRTAGKNAGSYEIEQGSLDGGDDYEIASFKPAAFTITPASLTITPEDKTKKQGTANPAFTFRYDGLAEGDQPSDLDVQPTAATGATKGSPIGYYDIEASGAESDNYTISYAKGKLMVTPANDANYSVKAWSSSPNTLTVKIYTTVAQKAAIILYTEVGQQVILQQHQLSVGINSFNVSVAHLASSTYVLSVAAEQFKDAQKIKIK